MIFMVIMIVTMLFMLVTLMFTMGSSTILDNGSYYMGITIPKKYRDNEAVKNIAAEYKRSWRWISLIGFLTCFVILLFYDYVSIQMVYLMIWFFALLYVYQQSLKKCGWKLYNWKLTQDWYNNDENQGKMIRIDTAVTTMRNRLPVRAYWIIPPVIGVCFCVSRYITAGFSTVSFSFAACAAVFLLLYFFVVRSRTKVYCDDSEVNLMINKSVKYEWSRCMLVHSYMACAIALLLSLSGTIKASSEFYGSTSFSLLAAAVTMLCSLGSMAVLFITYDNVQKMKNQGSAAEYYDDGDIYYLLGKKNPNAPAMQEKRVGIGFEMNGSGKLDIVVVIVIMLFVIGLAVFLLKYDLADVSLNISTDDSGRRAACVEAAGEKSRFYLDEVTDIEFLDELPDMSKDVGYDGTVYYIGSFNVSGYGECDTYICLKTDMAVVVKTTGRTYVFNDETEEGTRQMYESLH